MHLYHLRRLALTIVMSCAACLAQAVQVEYTTVNDWQSSFTGQIDITNDEASTIAGWTLEFDFPYAIGNIWGATIQSHSGDGYVLAPESWNGSINTGSTISIGFNATPGNVSSGPSNIVFNGASGSSSSSSSSSSGGNSSSSSSSSGGFTRFTTYTVDGVAHHQCAYLNEFCDFSGTATVIIGECVGNQWEYNCDFSAPVEVTDGVACTVEALGVTEDLVHGAVYCLASDPDVNTSSSSSGSSSSTSSGSSSTSSSSSGGFQRVTTWPVEGVEHHECADVGEVCDFSGTATVIIGQCVGNYYEYSCDFSDPVEVTDGTLCTKEALGVTEDLLNGAHYCLASDPSSDNEGQRCNWYGTVYPLCMDQDDGWGWENNRNCIGRTTCSSQSGGGGIID